MRVSARHLEHASITERSKIARRATFTSPVTATTWDAFTSLGKPLQNMRRQQKHPVSLEFGNGQSSEVGSSPTYRDILASMAEGEREHRRWSTLVIVLLLAGTAAGLFWVRLVTTVFTATGWKLDPWLLSWEPRGIVLTITWGGAAWFYRENLAGAGRFLWKNKPKATLLGLGGACLLALFLIQWFCGWASAEINVIMTTAIGALLIAGTAIGLKSLKQPPGSKVLAPAIGANETAREADLKKQLQEASNALRQKEEQIASLRSAVESSRAPAVRQPFPQGSGPILKRKLIKAEAESLIAQLNTISDAMLGYSKLPFPTAFIKTEGRYAPNWVHAVMQQGVPQVVEQLLVFQRAFEKLDGELDAIVKGNLLYSAELIEILRKPELAEMLNPIATYITQLRLVEKEAIKAQDVAYFVLAPAEERLRSAITYYRNWANGFRSIRYPAARREIEAYL
jgi:hypothetical protein